MTLSVVLLVATGSLRVRRRHGFRRLQSRQARYEYRGGDPQVVAYTVR